MFDVFGHASGRVDVSKALRNDLRAASLIEDMALWLLPAVTEHYRLFRRGAHSGQALEQLSSRRDQAVSRASMQGIGAGTGMGKASSRAAWVQASTAQQQQ
jgi:hypothetical protein